MVPPTLLTTMSNRPKASTAWPANSAVTSGWAKSAATTWARRPAARTWSATASSSDWVREAMTTSAPTSANASAMAAPRPRPPPVTTATLSSSRNLSRITGATVTRRPRFRNPISETRSSFLATRRGVSGGRIAARTEAQATARRLNAVADLMRLRTFNLAATSLWDSHVRSAGVSSSGTCPHLRRPSRRCALMRPSGR